METTTDSSGQELSHPDVQNLRITIKIPRDYQQDPILSELITKYGLKVNIFAAQLAGTGREDGWFDLGLSGHEFQITHALAYLSDQNVEIWNPKDQKDGDDW